MRRSLPVRYDMTYDRSLSWIQIIQVNDRVYTGVSKTYGNARANAQMGGFGLTDIIEDAGWDIMSQALTYRA